MSLDISLERALNVLCRALLLMLTRRLKYATRLYLPLGTGPTSRIQEPVLPPKRVFNSNKQYIPSRDLRARARTSFGAICVLVGGPDWPTSVLCGILKLPLPKILLGTTPIVLPIMFLVLTGGATVQVGKAAVTS